MVWYSNSRLPHFFQGLWRRLLLLGQCIGRTFYPVFGSALSAIRYLVRRDEECRGEPETNGISEELEGGHSEGPAEANPGGRPVDFMSERPAAEEEKSREFESEWYRVETTDELFCEYDSTWETEEGPRGAGSWSNRPRTSASHKFDKFKNAARDMQNYRRGYPFGTRTNHWNKAVFDDMSNLKFYLGERPSVPDGVYIKDFHTSWKGQYDVLECVHTFIQWLFPLEEQGMNYEARTLTKAEIEEFLKNPVATANLLESYKLMLDFYGIKLSNEATGEVTRAPNWRARFKNLNRNTHNNLRITRILKCLGILGYRHYQAPLVHFFLEETLVHRELQNIKDSVLNYFMFAVLNRRERRNLIKFAYLNYEPKHEFVWCPQKIQAIWLSQLCPDHREMREHDLSHSAVSEYK
ncbi:opioid growth factor receptor-like protein 1 isoform 2-T2 [Aulostomus maculatus]